MTKHDNKKPLIVGNKVCPNIRIVPNVGLEVLVRRRSQKQGGNVYQVVSFAQLARQVKGKP